MVFFKDFWIVIKNDFLDDFREFYWNGNIEKSMILNCIILVGRRIDRFNVRSFRFIILVISVYKIIVEVFLGRLGRCFLLRDDRLWMFFL